MLARYWTRSWFYGRNRTVSLGYQGSTRWSPFPCSVTTAWQGGLSSHRRLYLLFRRGLPAQSRGVLGTAPRQEPPHQPGSPSVRWGQSQVLHLQGEAQDRRLVFRSSPLSPERPAPAQSILRDSRWEGQVFDQQQQALFKPQQEEREGDPLSVGQSVLLMSLCLRGTDPRSRGSGSPHTPYPQVGQQPGRAPVSCSVWKGCRSEAVRV